MLHISNGFLKIQSRLKTVHPKGGIVSHSFVGCHLKRVYFILWANWDRWKSTSMKFLCNYDRMKAELKKWAGMYRLQDLLTYALIFNKGDKNS